jgi:hypothetical protein
MTIRAAHIVRRLHIPFRLIMAVGNSRFDRDVIAAVLAMAV